MILWARTRYVTGYLATYRVRRTLWAHLPSRAVLRACPRCLCLLEGKRSWTRTLLVRDRDFTGDSVLSCWVGRCFDFCFFCFFFVFLFFRFLAAFTSRCAEVNGKHSVVVDLDPTMIHCFTFLPEILGEPSFKSLKKLSAFLIGVFHQWVDPLKKKKEIKLLLNGRKKKEEKKRKEKEKRKKEKREEKRRRGGMVARSPNEVFFIKIFFFLNKMLKRSKAHTGHPTSNNNAILWSFIIHTHLRRSSLVGNTK